MGRLCISGLDNVDVARRNIFVRPPEPPEEVLMADPTNAIFIGRTKIFHVPFYWTFQKTTNPHICVVGITGSGKSYFVKTFLTRASYVWGTNAFIIDWAGEYRDWVKQVGGKVISLGRGSAINLLDTAGMKPNDRIKQIMRTLDILTDIGRYPEQKRLTELAIEKAYVSSKFKLDSKMQVDGLGRPLRPPTLRDVQKVLEDMSETGSYEFPAELENAIYRIRQFTREGEDFFAQQSTIDLEKLTHAGLVDLDLSSLPDETFRGLAALSMLQFIKEKMREEGWSSTKGLKLLVVLDEAWKVAKDDNSDAVMIVREGRKYQFGLIVASQNPTDISEAIFSNVGTTFVLRVKFERFLDYLQNTLNFSDYMREGIAKLGVGQAAVNMAFQATADFSETFLIDKIEGEEPMQEFFLDMSTVLSQEEMSMEGASRSLSFEKDELKKKMREYGMSEEQGDEITALFSKNGRRMEIAAFVVLLQRYGIARNNISGFLKELGLEDNSLVAVLSRSDELEVQLGDRDISEYVISEGKEDTEKKAQKAAGRAGGRGAAAGS